MVPNPPRLAHAAGGNDHLGGRIEVQRAGIVRALADIQVGKRDRLEAGTQNLKCFLIRVARQVAAENSGSLRREGTVHIHRKIREALDQMALLDLADKIQNLLCASHRKGRNDHIAAVCQRFVDQLRELRGVIVHMLVLLQSVGRFHHGKVRL